MRTMLDEVLKKVIQSLGFELRRLSPGTNPGFQLLKGLQRFEVDIVFDIGANTGQFASELRSVGYKGRIISFEPLSDAYQTLITAAAHDRGWTVHPRGAIGDFDGEIDINVAGNSVSSSVLPMLNSHSAAAVDSAYIGSERAPIYRLDSVASDYVQDSANYFIKVDTQGFEWQVLDGAREMLKQARGVMCELSLVPLYEGQRLWKDMLHRLEAEGFTLWSIQKGFTDPQDGRALQSDVILFRVT